MHWGTIMNPRTISAAWRGLVKNRYIGRTFINPDPGQRALGVRRKLNPLKDAITGKKLIVVDDSIVRGTTTRAMVAMLREAGAGRFICASRRRPTVGRASTAWTPGRAPNWWRLTSRWARFCDYIGADSLAYLSLDALKKATGVPGAGFCDACLTGNYPVPVSPRLSKTVLEQPSPARTGAAR